MNNLYIEQEHLIMNEENAEQVIGIIQEVVGSYSKKNSGMTDEEWAKNELAKYLPDMAEKEIITVSEEIIESIHSFNQNLHSLELAISNGTSKEKWFQNKVQESSVGMKINKVGQYLQEIDYVIANSNDLMQKTITNADGSINQNLNLDGFIFEQHHANTFNMDAVLKGSKYRAEAVQPNPGEVYKKNSVDIVIKDIVSGKQVKRYQAKLCRDSKATNDAFKKGRYNGQGKIVAKGQAENVKRSSDYISIKEKFNEIKSQSMSKSEGKQMQSIAQEGKSLEIDWNYYKLKDLTNHMTQNVAFASLQSATVAVGFDLVQRKLSGQKIDGGEVVEIALRTGMDSGIKNATTVGLKIASEKGLISLIPKGTPAGIIANVACVAIENVKVLGKVASGELTILKGLEKMERVTMATVSGLACSGLGMAEGAVMGAFALSWIPVIGPAVGGLIGGLVGGTVAYMAGSTIGETVCRGVQKVRNTAVNMVKSTAKAVKSFASSTVNTVKSFFS
ncbi:hypothetical protein ACFYKT_18440 [Cytobacillus sp. FJAT-53684]|uniref:LXG domain-containing protein n=1 Tax=Cytobacillus mangrovibacter TaxID=3299024 RepID=A0ABW6K2A8_9BACI